MSTRWRSTDPEAEDPELPLLDDAARVESEWLLAREEDPNAPAPSLKIASDYAEIEGLLSNLALESPDDSWQQDVLRAASALTENRIHPGEAHEQERSKMISGSSPPARSWWRRPILRWAIGGALGAAAVAGALVLIPQTGVDELVVDFHRVAAMRSGPKEVVVGDRLVVTARPHGAGDLRVYRSNGTLVARCPDGPSCVAPEHGELTIEITLDAPVQYQVLLVVGMGNALPAETADPVALTMDAYLEAARAASARIVTYPPINVH